MIHFFIVNHVNSSFEAKDHKMLAYLDIVKTLQRSFGTFNIQQVPRELNTHADALDGLSAVFKNTTMNIPIVPILKPTNQRMEEDEMVPVITTNLMNDTSLGRNWMQPYKNYLQHGILPTDRNEARALGMKASRFTIIDDVLFKKSTSGLLHRCLDTNKADLILRDIHEGECGNHTGGRNLSIKALRMGYYWPSIRQDSIEFVKKYDACQRHAPSINQPSEYLPATVASWPFMKWGMDIVGKMPPAPGEKIYMLAMTDYFSKWIEAGAFQQVTS